MKIACIYKIINLKNTKFYLGSTFDLNKRINTHLNDLRKDKHHNSYLQNAFNMYGESSFIFHIVELLDNKQNIREIEQLYIDSLGPDYNISKSTKAPMDGRKHTQETIQKMSGSKPERRGANCYMWGKKWTQDLRDKILKKRIGSKRNDKTKQRMRATAIAKSRYTSLLNSIELSKEPIIDNDGNRFESMMAASVYYNISVQTVCDILKRRHYKTTTGVTFNYLEKANEPYIHTMVDGEYRGIAFVRKRKHWIYNLTLRCGKKIRKRCNDLADTIKQYRELYFREYGILLCD